MSDRSTPRVDAIRSPYDGSVVGHAPLSGVDELDAAIATAVLAKGMTQTAAMHFVTVLSMPVFLQTLVPGVDRLIGPQSNLIISNVPGSRERLYFHGAKMVAHYPVSQVGHGMALNITVLSYAGGLHFGFVACPDAVPSVQRLAVHMKAAMEELEATFLEDSPRRAGKNAQGARKGSSAAKRNTRGARGPR